MAQKPKLALKERVHLQKTPTKECLLRFQHPPTTWAVTGIGFDGYDTDTLFLFIYTIQRKTQGKRRNGYLGGQFAKLGPVKYLKVGVLRYRLPFGGHLVNVTL